ncbi:MAG: ABC transporter ATP-binding protein [Deltaproteobacteria bacterium]|nr:ABC transporter ATP-binding protein [Deltaproteobacteria bacterium]
MIELLAVSKTFNPPSGAPVTALHGIDLSISRGEFVTLIGPSGSGKSSLLFTMGALMRPTAGAVRFSGSDLYALAARRRAEIRLSKVGFVFQTFNLLPYLSCLENVALPAVMAGRPRRAAAARAAGLLDRVGLGARLSQKPAELSVGERQRAAFCRGLVNDPEILLADEPTGNLDPATTAEVMAMLSGLHAGGQTILMVTHNHQLADYGERVVSIVGGRVEYDRPRHPRPVERGPRLFALRSPARRGAGGGSGAGPRRDCRARRARRGCRTRGRRRPAPSPTGGVGGVHVHGGAAQRKGARGRDGSAHRDGRDGVGRARHRLHAGRLDWNRRGARGFSFRRRGGALARPGRGHVCRAGSVEVVLGGRSRGGREPSFGHSGRGARRPEKPRRRTSGVRPSSNAMKQPA